MSDAPQPCICCPGLANAARALQMLPWPIQVSLEEWLQYLAQKKVPRVYPSGAVFPSVTLRPSMCYLNPRVYLSTAQSRPLYPPVASSMLIV